MARLGMRERQEVRFSPVLGIGPSYTAKRHIFSRNSYDDHSDFTRYNNTSNLPRHGSMSHMGR